MADAISATSSVAQSYAMDNRSQASSVERASYDAKNTQAVQGVESVDSTRADNRGATPLTESEKKERLEIAVEKINEMMRDGQRSLSFSVDEDLNQMIVTVKNTETDEIVRQIPNEDAIAISRHIESMMGLIFNDKA